MFVRSSKTAISLRRVSRVKTKDLFALDAPVLLRLELLGSLQPSSPPFLSWAVHSPTCLTDLSSSWLEGCWAAVEVRSVGQDALLFFTRVPCVSYMFP